MVPSCAGVGFSPALLVAESWLAMFFGYTGREQGGTLNKRCNDGSCPKSVPANLNSNAKSCHVTAPNIFSYPLAGTLTFSIRCGAPTNQLVIVGFIPDTRPRNRGLEILNTKQSKRKIRYLVRKHLKET